MIAASDPWAVAEALGTICAVVVALGIALAPAVVSRWERPRLKVALSDNEPHLIALRSPDAAEISVIDTVLLRLEVQNAGKRTARGVWATSGRRWRMDLPPDPDSPVPPELQPRFDSIWKLVDSEPITLRWSSLPPGEVRSGPAHVEIPPGRSDYVELAALAAKGMHNLKVAADDERVCRTDVADHQPVARHRWEVSFGCDEVEPTTLIVEFIIDGKSLISGICTGKIPEEADDVRLLHLLRGSD